VRGREERVDGPHGMAAGEQGVDDVRADEAGAAGDEDRVVAHGPGSLRNPLVASAA
jgi:hypothetical protein